MSLEDQQSHGSVMRWRDAMRRVSLDDDPAGVLEQELNDTLRWVGELVGETQNEINAIWERLWEEPRRLSRDEEAELHEQLGRLYPLRDRIREVWFRVKGEIRG